MSKFLNGVDYLLGIQRGEEFIPAAGQTETSIKRSAEAVDITTKDSNGWEEAEAGIKSWETSTDGLVVIDENNGYEIIEDAYMAGEKITIKVSRKASTQNGKGKIYTGKCIITGLDDKFGQKDKVSYSISLKGTGPLEISKEVAPTAQENKEGELENAESGNDRD